MVIMSVFQTEYESSILSTRSIKGKLVQWIERLSTEQIIKVRILYFPRKLKGSLAQRQSRTLLRLRSRYRNSQEPLKLRPSIWYAAGLQNLA